MTKFAHPGVVGALLSRGMTQHQISQELGISRKTLKSKIEELETMAQLMEAYAKQQSVHVALVKLKVLEGITEEKIQEATLGELINTFRILDDKERLLNGKSGDVSAFVQLVSKLAGEMDVQEKASNSEDDEDDGIIDVTPNDDGMPRL